MRLLRVFLSITVLSIVGATHQSHLQSQQTNYQRQSSQQVNPQPGNPQQLAKFWQQIQQQNAQQGRGQPQNMHQQPMQNGQTQNTHQQQMQNGQTQNMQQQPMQNIQAGQRNQYRVGSHAHVPQSNPQLSHDGARMGGQESAESLDQPKLPLDEPIDNGPAAGGGSAPHDEPSKALLDGINQLSEEIAEAVIEKLEEDEAMAIELEKQGFDPDADVYSSQESLKPTLLLCVIIMLLYI